MGSSDSTSIFLSYSRRDNDTAEAVALLLRGRGYAVLRDLDDILPTEEWRERLAALIEAADAVVFLLSPASAASKVCAWEVEYATQLHKKIAPIVVANIAGAEIPPLLSRLNYIFATDAGRVEHAVLTLCEALSGTAEWLREHTRLTARALRYAEGLQRSELLTAAELAEALKWLARRPEDVPPVARLVQRLIEESQAHEDALNRFNEQKIDAVRQVIGPVIAARIAQLQEEAAPLSRLSGQSAELRSEMETLRNVAEPFGRWHPMPARRMRCGGVIDDYAEYFQFPCCGASVMLHNIGQPLQFRADGCYIDPHDPKPKSDRIFVLEHARRRTVPIAYEADLRPHLPDRVDEALKAYNACESIIMAVAVRSDGTIAELEVVRSSGHIEADRASEDLVMSRYTYDPALDAHGQPVAETVREEIGLPLARLVTRA